MSADGDVGHQSHCSQYKNDVGDEDELWDRAEKNQGASQEAREVSNAFSPLLA